MIGNLMKNSINESEIQITSIRSPGPGGQNVNKVATGILLRFNLDQSSLPDSIKARLRVIAENKITQEGDLLIKAVRHRTREANKKDALCRLQQLIHSASFVAKKRKKTRPSLKVKEKRLSNKKTVSKKKELRKKVSH